MRANLTLTLFQTLTLTLTLILSLTLTCVGGVARADLLAAGLRPGARVVTVDSMLPNRGEPAADAMRRGAAPNPNPGPSTHPNPNPNPNQARRRKGRRR